ncbi:MAG TPA: asparagine synthase-related protein, partial [Dongiaceae bacterium]|nr:asparagine synthase-related protein [Dongiaceae bacterium]
MTAFIGRLDHGDRLRFQCTATTDVERCRVAFTGYLANRNALLAELRPQDASTTTDAQLVALAYRRWGEGAQAHLLGEYAFALFEPERGALLLGHDALGLVPLFVAERGGALTFATDLAELVGATGVGEVDEEYVADCLALVRGRDERTPYRHIRRLLPGRGAAVRNGAIVTITAYDPALAKPVAPAPSAEYAERLRELIVEAVASALPSTGTVWSDLSGGLDSSTIVSVALGTLGTKLEVVSAVFGRSQQADETEWMDAVLDTYPAPSHRIDADTVPPFSALPDRFHPEPNGAPVVAAFNDARDALLRAHGVDVVLTGACGDAVFFGDSPAPYALADSHPFALAGAVRRWAARAPGHRSFAYWFQRYVVTPRLRRLAGAGVMPRPALAPWMRTEYVRSMDLAGRSRRRFVHVPAIGGEYFWDRIHQGACITSTGQYRSPATYAHRNPLLYLPLVEFMVGVPWAENVSPDADRVLQRRALHGILPERTRLRRGKRGPNQAIFSGLESGRAWLEMLTARSALVERGYADPERWREMVKKARGGWSSPTAALMQAVALE